MAFLRYQNLIAIMSQIETEAPPAYSPYRGDDTAGQAGGVSDISNLTDSIGE